MIKTMIKLDSQLIDIRQEAEKALTILGDLVEDYSLFGDEPTQEKANKIGHEASRVMQFTSIALDYVFSIKEEISHVTDDFNIIWDMTKKANEAPTDKKGICKEQINAILDNMNESELKQVYEFALNGIFQGVGV